MEERRTGSNSEAYQGNGGGGGTAQNLRAYADDARRTAEDYVARARELVLRYPTSSLLGAVAAGFLFARLVARRR